MDKLFNVFETNEFIKRIGKLEKLYQKRLQIKLDKDIYPQLRENPFYGNNIKKLADWEPDTWRYKWRSFRIFYEIDSADKIISITTIKKRKDAY